MSSLCPLACFVALSVAGCAEGSGIDPGGDRPSSGGVSGGAAAGAAGMAGVGGAAPGRDPTTATAARAILSREPWTGR